MNKSRGVRSIFNSIAKILFVVLFVSYYIGGTAFTHIHYFPGYTITHSHPYASGTDGLPHHTHSSVAFSTIEQLNEIEIEDVLYFTALGMTWVLLSIIIQSYNVKTFLRPVLSGNLRAPPVFM